MKKFLLVLLALVMMGGFGAGYFCWKNAQGVPAEAAEDQYMTRADRFLTVAGARIRVREEGPREAPAILLLHGFVFSLETWDAWAAALSTDYRVIRYDLLGHGLTGPDPMERYAPDERAAFIGEVLDALDLERVVIAGNSLGGLAAWRFASNNPERVDALILLAPGGYSINGVGAEPVDPPAPMKLFLQTAPETGVKATLEAVFADDARATPERVALMRDMMRREGNGNAFIQSIEEFVLPDPQEDLTRLTAPTLIFWGRKDALIPVAHAERFEAAIPDAELIVYDDVGHVPQEEAPERSVKDVREFLDESLGAMN